MQAPADPPEAGAEAEAVLGQNAAKSSSSEATEAKAVSTKVQVPNDSDMISEPQTRYRDPYSNMQSASSHPLRLYTANLIVALPPSPYQHPEQPTQLQITLKLQEPYPGQQTVSSSAGPVIEIPLRVSSPSHF